MIRYKVMVMFDHEKEDEEDEEFTEVIFKDFTTYEDMWEYCFAASSHGVIGGHVLRWNNYFKVWEYYSDVC